MPCNDPDAARVGNILFQSRILGSGDFLATWAVEVAIHHLDLGKELRPDPPASTAMALARQTVESLLEAPLPSDWDDVEAVMVGSGRQAPGRHQEEQLGAIANRLPALA